MTVGERIRSARKAAGLTQAQLAKKLGVPYQSVGQWERGTRNPKYETLERIAAALETSASELMGLGAVTEELLLKSYEQRERAAAELGLEPPPSPGRFLQSGLPKEELEFLGEVEALSAIQKCLWALGFKELPGPPGDPEDETAALLNPRTGLVYIVRYDDYLDLLEEVLRDIKRGLSRLFDGAEERLDCDEARKRGIWEGF